MTARAQVDPLGTGGPWHERQMVGFDIESTSPDPEEAHIVSAGLVVCTAGKSPAAVEFRVNPGVPIPAGATEVHGITDEDVKDSPGPAEVVPVLLSLLAGAVDSGRAVVIFNARYDLTVLDREARRLGVNPEVLERLLVVDPLVLDRHLDRYRKGSRKLAAQAEHYGANLAEAHDACQDAVTACRLAWRIATAGEVVRNVYRDGTLVVRMLREEWARVRHDLPDLHEAQSRWAYAEAVRLAEHFRSVGKTDEADGVRPEWPVVPMRDGRRAA